MTKDEELSAIFAEVFDEYNSVNAEFVAFREFKCTWERTARWIALRVSDYLEDAPAEALRELATYVKGIIAGERQNVEGALREFVTAPEFSRKFKDTYIMRAHLERDGGSLESLREKLKAKGLYPEGFDDVDIVWNCDTQCRCSVLMRVVSVPLLYEERLTDPIVLKEFYGMFAHIFAGYGAGTDEYAKVVCKWRD